MNPTVEQLRSSPTFADQTEEILAWLASQMEVRQYEAGELVSEEGSPAELMVVVLDGELQGRRESDGMDTRVYIAPKGMVTGKLPYSRMVKFPMTTRATVKTIVATLHQQHFTEMLRRMPEVGARLVELMVDRTREATTQEQARDKMEALGKLSAGLAHELNNPAAAACRSAARIREALAELRRADRALASSDLSPHQYCAIAEVEEELATRTRESPALDALDRSDREQAIGEFLDEHGVENAWELAGSLVDANFAAEQLSSLSEKLGDSAIGPALAKLSASVTIVRLAEEINDASAKISDLVKAIKEYTHMDQTPDQPVDLYRSIETTLTILNHRLKQGVKVVRAYDESLPKIQGFGGELNQVWTNLITNAIDAMNGKGELRIRTGCELDGVFVEIGDNGPGIPNEMRTRIYEPFFTTKKMGDGTGLGLDIVRRIVNKHHGLIRLESKPGDTRFHVWLPRTQQPAGKAVN